ncbi:MAG: phenylacetate--CoA ligase family protein [Caldimonas sp.]
MLPPFDPWRTGVVAADVIAATYASADALAGRQAHRLAALLAAAAQRSPMYRRLLAGRDPSGVRLQELPVVRKAELMHGFDAWVADPAIRLDPLRRFTADPACVAEPFLGRYVVWESSGSSGEPAIFVQDAAAMAVYDALEALRRPLASDLGRAFDPWGLAERIAFVGAIGGHFASNVSIERLRRLNPALAGRLRCVSFMQPVEQLVAELQTYRPNVIATYPSAAVLLAEERRAGRLEIAPREVWTGGETLSPAMRQFVQEAFGCKVVNSYGASEFLTLACECSSGSLHLNADWAILESVDEHGVAVAPGVTGAATLITNLANHVQPLIRYDIGDRVTIQALACRCGSKLPVIDVLGRCDDILRFGAPERATVNVLPLALTTVLEDDANLFDFQLVQTGPRGLLLSTPRPGAAAEGDLRRARMVLGAFLAAQGAEGVRIRCSSGRPGRLGRTGKLQRVIASLA